jgi:hypothetical protein
MVRKIRSVVRAVREVSRPTFDSAKKQNEKMYKLAKKLRKQTA